MIKHVKRKFGPGPLMGRQAFRGGFNPLILGGGKYGLSPDIWAAEYADADPNPVAVEQQKNTMVQPAVEVCPTSRLLNEWCDQNPSMGFCKKRNLPASSSECRSIQEPECPRSVKLIKEVCNLYNSPYMEFCKGFKINGQCYEERIRQDEEEIRLEKEAQDKRDKEEAAAKAKADAEAEQVKINNWKVTRGCKFQRADITQAQIEAMIKKGINPITTKTPCSYPQFNTASVGQTVSIYGQPWKFLGWSPEQP